MLTVSNVSCRLADVTLFDHLNFTVNAGDRIGLVGPNGSGKSTLLRIIAGDLMPTSGSVSRTASTRIGFLRQGFADMPGGTLADLLDVPTDGLFRRKCMLDEATLALASTDQDPMVLVERFERASDAFEAAGGYTFLSEIEALLDRFGLGDMSPGRPLDHMSGGQKTRAGLAALLATRPNLLILDEPTNHLDESALNWLFDYLNGYDGALIIVSHDRAFLDGIVTKILAIDPVRKTGTIYPGNYSDFVAAREHERSEAESAWHRQQVEVARIQRDIRATEQKSRNIEASTIDFAVRKKAAKIVRPAVVRKKKLAKLLDNEEAAEKATRSWGIAPDFGEVSDGARDVVIIDDATIQLGDRIILQGVRLHVRHGDRIAITGDNGTGKTTLMRAIAGDIAPTRGTIMRGPGVIPGYFSQEQQTLRPSLTVLQQAQTVVSISETDLRNELHKFLFGGDTVHKLVGDLSYGERARLMLALLVLQRTTLLLLDEPLNHLDIDARESFEHALLQFRGTMIMVLHDRYAIERLATHEWKVEDGTVTVIT